LDPMESAWRLLKRQTTLTGDFGFPENPRNRYRGEYVGPIHVPTESLEIPTMEEVYNQPNPNYVRHDFPFDYGNTIGDIRNIAEANAQADFDPNSMLWEAGRPSPPNVRFTTQMTLPQMMPGLTTERWLDPQTNTVIPGSIPPINAYRYTGAIAPRVMTTPGGQLIPMSGREYSGSYEEGQRNPLPYRYRTKEGLPMQFSAPPYAQEMRGISAENRHNLFGIRGLGHYPEDLVQERPRHGGGETAEYVAMTPIDRTRLTPLRASGTRESDKPDATNWELRLDDRDWLMGQMDARMIEDRLRNPNPLDRLDNPWDDNNKKVTPQQAAWREYASQFPISAIHPALEGAYDREGFPLQPGGREMTTEEKLELIDYMREKNYGHRTTAAGPKTIIPPGQLVTSEIRSASPLGLMRYGTFQQGFDKMPPEMKQSAIEALKRHQRYY